MSEQPGSKATVSLPLRSILAMSAAILRVERVVIVVLMGLLTLLILVNVVTRYTGFPVYWIDESAVYAMVWLTFVGASAMSRLRLDFGVNLLTERLDARSARLVGVVATMTSMAFGLALLAMCWAWMDPVGLARAGFDARAFAASTFNFLYTERTQTLNWPSWMLYLILPVFAASITIHGLCNLLEDLGAIPKSAHPIRELTSVAEAV